MAIMEGYAPGNGETRKQVWQPVAALRFLGNLPFWARDMLRRPGALRRLWARAQARRNGHRESGLSETERRAVRAAGLYIAVDVAEVPQRMVRLMRD